MNQWIRFLMGIAIIAILAPAIAVVMPDRITSWLPWHGDSSAGASVAPAMASVDRELQLAEASPTDRPPTTAMTAFSLATAPTRETDAAAESKTTSTMDPDESHESPDGKTNTGNQDPTTTTQSTSGNQDPTSTTRSTSSSRTSQTITGQACPCTVSGTVELKGNVSLEGDLIVDSGTLIARPGVDVNGNGYQILFKNGGKADFQGSKVFTWSDRGAKQNLKRDINFRSMRRIIWMGSGGASTLRYFTVSDSGTSSLGDYPLHWHLNGSNTSGTLVEGVVVVNGKNHAFVPHGSHGITFRDTIAKNTKGDAYWWDPPGSNGPCTNGVGCDPIDNSNDIVYDHALVDGVTGDRGVSGFVLGAGDNLVVRNSAAININSTNPSKRFCAGFKWPEFTDGSSRGVNTVWTFRDNYSHSPSGCDGINVWQNDSAPHIIDGFTGSGIDHGAYGNSYLYMNFDVDDVLIHAAGWQMKNGHAGDVVAVRHRSERLPTVEFDNVIVDSFTINNATDGGDVPGHYVLRGSGLTCAEIQYTQVVPGTRVILDGVEC